VLFLLPELLRALFLDPYGVPLSESIFTRDSFIFGSPSVVWYALFSSFAYRLTKDWWINNKRINELEKEKTKQELALLKKQFDPHFLFNNLNIIDGLIEEDKEKASKALHSLAKLYQYLLATSGKDLVPVSQEYDFIISYLYLLRERFSRAYEFEVDENLKGVKDHGLPPGALQVLIENAVKHNAGSTTSPLKISIKLDDKEVVVENSVRLKNQSITGHGQGLNGLQKRYLLLGDKQVHIERGDTFRVRLPLIPLSQ
jgi:LytS/YehU family sensor histidine kinase